MTKKASRVVEAILEMADDQLRSGLLNKDEHEKITLRHLGQRRLASPSLSVATKSARCESRQI